MGSLINESEFRAAMRELVDTGKKIGRTEVINELFDWLYGRVQPGQTVTPAELRLKLQYLASRNREE